MDDKWYRFVPSFRGPKKFIHVQGLKSRPCVCTRDDEEERPRAEEGRKHEEEKRIERERERERDGERREKRLSSRDGKLGIRITDSSSSSSREERKRVRIAVIEWIFQASMATTAAAAAVPEDARGASPRSFVSCSLQSASATTAAKETRTRSIVRSWKDSKECDFTSFRSCFGRLVLAFPPSSRPPHSLCLCRRLSVFSGFICLERFSD